jgi:hypothetical protein
VNNLLSILENHLVIKPRVKKSVLKIKLINIREILRELLKARNIERIILKINLEKKFLNLIGKGKLISFLRILLATNVGKLGIMLINAGLKKP